MIFIVFLVSLGTLHVILATEERRKRNRVRPTQCRTVPADLSRMEPCPRDESTGDLWSLARVLEDHGHGEKPDVKTPEVPAAPKAPLGDC